MKRQIVRNLDTDHIPLDRLSALLQTFALKHAARELPEILERADSFSIFWKQRSGEEMNGAERETSLLLTSRRIPSLSSCSIRWSWSPESARARSGSSGN